MNFANDTTTLIIIIPFNHRQLPKAGNLNKKFPVGRFWRFQVDFKTQSDQKFNLRWWPTQPSRFLPAEMLIVSFFPGVRKFVWDIQYNTIHVNTKYIKHWYHNVPLRERAAVGQWLDDSEKQVVNQAGSPTHCHGSRGIWLVENWNTNNNNKRDVLQKNGIMEASD